MDSNSTHKSGPDIDRISVAALAVSLLFLISGACFAMGPKLARATCVANLHRIGESTLIYCDDNDGLFPTTFAFYGQQVMWPQKLEPYLMAGMSDHASEGIDIDTKGGGQTTLKLGWADSGGPTWHCPEDHDGGNVSYGANALIGGADTTLGGNWSHVRNEWWVPSLRRSEIPEPGRVIWAGDTNKFWQDDAQRFTAVFADWDRSDPRVSGRKATAMETTDWFRKFLKEDHTFDQDDCDPPGLYNCKGPAYRHGWHGPGTGSAGMVFCDGHAAVLPFGSIRVENIMPMVPEGPTG